MRIAQRAPARQAPPARPPGGADRGSARGTDGARPDPRHRPRPLRGQRNAPPPVVVTQGARPATAPPVPELPPGAVVTIDFGSPGMDLAPAGATARALAQGHCVSGPRAVSAVASCNGAAFFAAALPLMRAGLL